MKTTFYINDNKIFEYNHKPFCGLDIALECAKEGLCECASRFKGNIESCYSITETKKKTIKQTLLFETEIIK